MISAAKKAYKKPIIEKVGSFEQVTQAGSRGSVLDADFPGGTPFGDLTFS